MRVKLLSHTENPLETIWRAWQLAKTDEPLEEILSKDVDKDVIHKILNTEIPITQMVDFVFLLEGVSVSFREQLVRHRLGTYYEVQDIVNSSFWMQSMRVQNMSQFDYETPDSIFDRDEEDFLYTNHMRETRSLYHKLVEAGIPREDARMVIPLAAHHRIVWKTNLQILHHIIGKRCCWIMQGTLWKPVIQGVVQELRTKIHPLFGELSDPPCVRQDGSYSKCVVPANAEERRTGDDPNPPCPLYNKFEATEPCEREIPESMLAFFEDLWQRDLGRGGEQE